MYFLHISIYLIATFAIENVISFNVEVMLSPKTLLGVRAHWDEAQQSLYYCDVYGNESSILRYDYNEDKVYTAGIDGEYVVPFIIPVANSTDKYAVSLGKGVGIINWDGKTSTTTRDSIAFEFDSDKSNNRFNAAKADPSCRFHGGIAGKVYKFEKGNGLSEVLDNVYISNGMAWDENKNKFYYIDSGKFDIKEYDYDPNTGDISNETVIVKYTENGKNPDYFPAGLTIDTDGNLYVTFYRGSKILKIDPKDGKVLLEILLPAKQVTSVAFGGPDLDILYATSAAFEDVESEYGGSLFKITGLSVKGYPGDKVCI